MLDALPHFPVQAVYIGMPILMALVVWISFKLTIFIKYHAIDFDLLKTTTSSRTARARANFAHFISNHILLSVVDRTTIFCHLEPENCLTEILKRSHIHLDDQFDEVLNQEAPLLWGNLPNLFKNRVYATAHHQLPRMADDLMEDIIDEIETLWDLEETVFNKLQRQPELQGRLLHEVLKTDLNKSYSLALFVGLCCGFLQAVICYNFQQQSVFIGSGVVFSVLATIWLLRFVKEQYFLEKEEKVKESYDQLSERVYGFLAEHFFTPNETFKQIFTGVHQVRTQQLVRKHTKGITDGSILKPITQIGSNFETYVQVKNQLTNKLTHMLVLSVEDYQFNRNRTYSIKNLFIERAQKLNYSEKSKLIASPLASMKVELVILGGLIGAGIGAVEFLLFL